MIVCGKLGMTSAMRIGLLFLLSIVASGGLAAEAEKEKQSPGKAQGTMHTIDARVTYSAGSTAGTNILAERQPGYFKVPAGQVARDFKFSFVDPKSNIERDKLNDNTIYCETTKQWVKIPADPQTLELPPGEYKFVVGGTPGANGTLNFRTFAEPPPAAQGEIRHATARVIQGYKDPYSFAQLESGPFTVPEGYFATKFIYRWEDPKTGRQNDQLTATTIYSVTRGRYVAEAKNNPDIQLPAGDYKLVCGGTAGASGALTYTLIREDLVNKTDDVVKTTPTKTLGEKHPIGDLSKPHDPLGPGGADVLLLLPKNFDVVMPEIDFSKQSIEGFRGSSKGAKDGPFVLRFRDGIVTADQHWTAYLRQKGENPNIVEWQFRLKFNGTFERGVLRGKMTWYHEEGIREIRYPQSQEWRQDEVLGQSDMDGKMTARCVLKSFKSIGYDPIREAWVENPEQKPMGDLRFEIMLPVGQLQSSQKFVPEGKVPPIPKME